MIDRREGKENNNIPTEISSPIKIFTHHGRQVISLVRLVSTSSYMRGSQGNKKRERKRWKSDEEAETERQSG